VVQEIVAHAAHAAALTHVIERIGSYAGFAAVIGLAVLSALYFSQARDVRRLREWAGRAPERAAEQQQGGRTAHAAAVRTGQPARTVGQAQPVGQQARPATAPGTGSQPAVAQGAAASPSPAVAGTAAAAASPGAGPATATAAAPATAAPGQAKPGVPAAGGAAQRKPATGAPGAGRPATGAPATAAGAAPGTAVRPAGAGAAGTAVAGNAATAGTAAAAGSAGGVARGNTGTGAKVLPARSAQAQRPRPIQPVAGRSGHTAVIPPPKRERRWTAPRYLALIVAGVIALTGDSSGSHKSKASAVKLPKGTKSSKGTSSKSAVAPVDPASITVAVLNGTQVTGLAGTTGQKVTAAGFRLGNVATASQQAPRAESVVLYRAGASRQARTVARKLSISQIEPADSQSEALAGTATVIVVVGADLASGD
jgi:hypothetical protein